MNEIGVTIVTHAAAMQLESSIAQDRRRDCRQTNVNSLCLHVQAVPGDTRVRASVPQVLVALRRAVSANDVDLAVEVVNGRGQIMKKIEQARIKMVDVTSTVIAKKVIQLGQSLLRIGVAPAIHDVEPLAGVCVIETQPILRSRLHGIGTAG